MRDSCLPRGCCRAFPLFPGDESVSCACTAVQVNLPLFVGTGRIQLRCDFCLHIWEYSAWLHRRDPSTSAPPSTGEAVPGNGSPTFFRRLAVVDDSDSRLPTGLRVRSHRVVGSLSSWKEKKEN